jgi:hypothetical protein
MVKDGDCVHSTKEVNGVVRGDSDDGVLGR